jgi:hypothetical protein
MTSSPCYNLINPAQFPFYTSQSFIDPTTSQVYHCAVPVYTDQIPYTEVPTTYLGSHSSHITQPIKINPNEPMPFYIPHQTVTQSMLSIPTAFTNSSTYSTPGSDTTSGSLMSGEDYTSDEEDSAYERASVKICPCCSIL